MYASGILILPSVEYGIDHSVILNKHKTPIKNKNLFFIKPPKFLIKFLFNSLTIYTSRFFFFSMIKKTIKEIGTAGEKLAKEFLISNNYEIIDTNFHSPYGEIDIIAEDNGTLVFIEVKTRSTDLDSALNSISISKRKKISKTASYFLSKNRSFEAMFTRFDVIIIITSKSYTSLKHIKEAFIPTF